MILNLLFSQHMSSINTTIRTVILVAVLLNFNDRHETTILNPCLLKYKIMELQTLLTQLHNQHCQQLVRNIMDYKINHFRVDNCINTTFININQHFINIVSYKLIHLDTFRLCMYVIFGSIQYIIKAVFNYQQFIVLKLIDGRGNFR